MLPQAIIEFIPLLWILTSTGNLCIQCLQLILTSLPNEYNCQFSWDKDKNTLLLAYLNAESLSSPT